MTLEGLTVDWDFNLSIVQTVIKKRLQVGNRAYESRRGIAKAR